MTTKCWTIYTDFSHGTGGLIWATEGSDEEHMVLGHADQAFGLRAGLSKPCDLGKLN